MPKLHYIKLAANFVIGASVSKVVKDIISFNTEAESPIEQIEITVGSLAIGMMVADYTKEWTDTKIDFVAEQLDSMKADNRH